MSNATSPRKRGHAGRSARARFVELENILPVSGPPPAGGLVIEIDGLRLILSGWGSAWAAGAGRTGDGLGRGRPSHEGRTTLSLTRLRGACCVRV
ncbi:MAG: hypothetical protein J0M04_09580 [Verrucomicrobia bacterium]|nr:hypothetical protein [Verrucomicrobiota bacterium]